MLLVIDTCAKCGLSISIAGAYTVLSSFLLFKHLLFFISFNLTKLLHVCLTSIFIKLEPEFLNHNNYTKKYNYNQTGYFSSLVLQIRVLSLVAYFFLLDPPCYYQIKHGADTACSDAHTDLNS